MNINEAFPSKYLKAADIKGHPPVPVTISHYTMEKMADGEDQKPVLYFQGKNKGLVLNVTNANMIAHTHGPEFEGWFGKTILLRCEAVPFGGKVVDSIRVSVAQVPQDEQYAQEQAATHQTMAPEEGGQLPPAGTPPPPADFSDDEIPF